MITTPITLKPHVLSGQILALMDCGITVKRIPTQGDNGHFIAYCKTTAQTEQVERLNQASAEQQAERAAKPIRHIKQVMGDYYFPEDMEDDYLS